MTGSIGKTIAKIAAGLFIIAAMFGSENTQGGAVVAGCMIGLAFIAWGVVPIITERRDEKKKAARQAEKDRRVREQIEAQEKAAAERPRICARCGASTKGTKCEYCGSPLDE